MLEEWIKVVTGLVYSLFGAGSLPHFQEWKTLYSLLIPALLLGLGGAVCFMALRAARRTLLEGRRGLDLWRSPSGRRVRRLAREIREGSRRLGDGLLNMQKESAEGETVGILLERFLQQELPHTLTQARSFIMAGGGRRERRLRKELGRQQRLWSDSSDTSRRERLNKEIAVTKQSLAQTEQANRSLTSLVEGLEEAARALRGLEVELASLGAERGEDFADIRERLNEMALGLRHQREAHRSLRDSR